MIPPRLPRPVMRSACFVAALLLVLPEAGFAAPPREQPASSQLRLPNTQFEPVAFSEIEGWNADSQADAFATFLASCRAILKSVPKPREYKPRMFHALRDICGRAVAAVPLDDDGARTFFEKNFRAFRISPLGERDGFITGYYEPIVDGARFPSDKFNVPLYRRPPDMIMSRLRQHRAPRGKAAWRARPKSAPYFDRAQIEDGAIAGRGLEICYLKDPIDSFFAQVQGSVRVRLEDGSIIRLNYDSANGHAYTSVGRFLVDRGIIAREDISMQRIRDWMEKNPEEGKALRRENKSFVFFRETNLQEFDEAVGAQGLSLTAGRSIAVDRNLHTYGTPFFLDAVLPIVSEKPDTRFRRLMIAQDTGGAIVGPARADIYLGAGDDAARPAGRFKQFGRFVMLIPKDVNPAIVVTVIPLPRPRPADKPDVKSSAAPAPQQTTQASAATPLPRAHPHKTTR